MGNIRQEKFREDPVLNLNKRLKLNSRNKKFGTRTKESMVFKILER